ncbi:SEC-C motif-containing protein [Kribbella sp. VKM Ac-2527]|uniref:SEC-C motif-containing protein n=2 Tax=Kribbella caucasensis TaxID=2512215 RepID=A0A4R6J3T7_9ACTN|nr:SEC-C motif-containing protein [Kribbella sp. VKM Ac-2527]
MADELRTNQDGIETSRREVLLDAAQDHLRDRQPERSIAIWQQLIDEGGEDADDARLDYADYLFGQFRDDEAWTELAAIMAGGRTLSSAWMCAAELIEERGELATALAWYSLAAESLTSEDMTTSAGLFGAERLVAGRRRVKWALGIPLSDFDLLGEMGDTEAEDRDAVALLSSPWVINGRILVWDRGEFDAARQRWPYQITAKSADEYCRQVELDLREDGGRITVVPVNVNGWLKCLTALHLIRSRDDLGQVATQCDEGRSVGWPPPRNRPCWCGSGMKYKKCCGSNAA